VSKPTVIQWRRRYVAEGIGGLEDRVKSGRPKQIDDVAIVQATLDPPPESLGVTHWSTRLLAAHLGISNYTVAKAWQRWGLRPWQRQTFKFSTDPELEAKIRDVVGLYLDPPEKAVVLCVYEKSQIQALDRTAPILRCVPGCRRRPPTTTSGTAPRRCSRHWRSRPARSPTPATPGTDPTSSCGSSNWSPRPIRG
jgi:transposase